MAQPYVTGPVHLYVSVPSSAGGALGAVGGAAALLAGGSPRYLGTCETAPTIHWDAAWEPVINDISGSRKPFDMIYEGADAMVSGDLTVFNWGVWERIKALPSPAGVSGTNVAGDIGTLMVLEGMAYTLWCQYPYAAKAVMTPMVSGHRFLAAFMTGAAEAPGTKANKFRVNFMCIRVYNPTNGAFVCSDNNMAGIPAVPPVAA